MVMVTTVPVFMAVMVMFMVRIWIQLDVVQCEGYTMGCSLDCQLPSLHEGAVGGGVYETLFEAIGLECCTPMVIVGVTIVWIASGLGLLNGLGHELHPVFAVQPSRFDEDIAHCEGFSFPGIAKIGFSLLLREGS